MELEISSIELQISTIILEISVIQLKISANIADIFNSGLNVKTACHNAVQCRSAATTVNWGVAFQLGQWPLRAQTGEHLVSHGP